MTITSNILWALAGKITTLFSGLVVGIFVARYLGPEQFGLLNWVISFVFLFQVVSVFGLDSIEVREEAKKEADYNTILGTSFILRLVLSVICVFLCIATCLLINKSVTTISFVALYSISIIFNSLSVIRNYFFSIVQNKRVVQSEISRTLIGVVFKGILLWLQASLVWFMFALLLDTILLGTGYVIAYKKDVGNIRQWKFSPQYCKVLIKESFPLLLTSAAVIIYQRIDQVMIGEMIDEENVGYFSVAARFVEILIFIPAILSQTITPILVKAYEANKNDYLDKGQKFMNISVWISFLAALCTSLLSYWLVTLLFGQAYLPAVVILQVMSFKAASVALSNTAGAMLVVEGLQRYAIFRDIMGCLVCIIMNWYFLPRYGIIVAAFIAIASNLVAGYVADAVIPQYRHLFRMQTIALFTGYKELLHFRDFLYTSNRNF